VLLFGDVLGLIDGLLEGLELDVARFNRRKLSSRPRALDATCGFGANRSVGIGVYGGGGADGVFQMHAQL
jgi:hypothetical protein